MRYYEIAPTKLIRADHASFTYASPDALPIGSFVYIPVGKTTLLGIVISGTTKPAYSTRSVVNTLPIPALPKELVQTALWMSKYYHTHLATVFQTILPRGITKKRRQSHVSGAAASRKRTKYVLNSDQQSALHELLTASPGTVILHGITGSGKTAVYIEYAKEQIKHGKSVIILVPEIALTSQLVAEFTQHFSDIVLTHSRQTESERHTTWLSVATSSRPQVIIGPRSALFMPLSSIGAIIIDEAHEPSFKQDQSPRYSALRVASVMAKLHNALAIQGSATPLVAEYYLAQHNKRPIISLPHHARSDVYSPTLSIVDMTNKTLFTKHRIFSDILIATMKKTLLEGDQVLVFHNRRGSAAITLCTSCGWTATCLRCSIPFTLHADLHLLRCHICGQTSQVPTSCPICHSTDILHKGIGTKLIESELKKIFPTYQMIRFDGDSSNGDTVEHQYQALYEGKIQIIIGTQVIAKGLDLPHLRTVSIIQADTGLSLPDFTASERTFQLIAQVIGRVGRSHKKTNAVIQSYTPNSAIIHDGITQNYTQFYTDTLATRRRSVFPPFVYLLKLTCTYRTETTTIKNSNAFKECIAQEFPDVITFGPTPAFYEHQHETYRWQIVVKSAKRHRLLEIVDMLPPTHWQYDIDPASLL